MSVLTKAISLRVFSIMMAGSLEGQRRKVGANTIDRLEASIFVTLATSALVNKKKELAKVIRKKRFFKEGFSKRCFHQV